MEAYYAFSAIFLGGSARKISGSLAKDIVTAAQFTIFTFQLFQTLMFSGGKPTITAPGIPLMLATPDTQSLRCTANLWAMEQIAAHGESYSP